MRMVAATALCAAAASAQSRQAGEVSLDSLLNTHISAAAKYLQTSAEAAASITIVSAEEIRQNGYTNLQQLLENVPGMYVSNDRNYAYLGTRGFSRPSDYNNRILLLIDGHSLNEQVWGSAPIGSDLPINMSAIERVEVVRGPGSALYGSSALFAVINVVTRTGTQSNGATMNARLGSGFDRAAAVSVGYPLGRQVDFGVSAFAMHSNGGTLEYPEFATMQTSGTVRHLDWESGRSVLGYLTARNVTTRFGYRDRQKGVPTGSYDVLFADARSATHDQTTWGEVKVDGSWGAKVSGSLRLYGDRNFYRRNFPYSAGPLFTGRSVSSVAGSEGLLIWDIAARNRFTVGSEFRRVLTANFYAVDDSGVARGDNAPFTMQSLFAQDEMDVLTGLKLVGGIRFDQKVHLWSAAAPRFAVIASPGRGTTIKLLYGEAYRAPSVAEADLETEYYMRNPALKPERVETYELAAEHRLVPAVMLGASVYRYDIQNLIEQASGDTANGANYRNVFSVHGRGAELSATLQPSFSPVAIRGWYAVQKSRDDSTWLQLTNSPQHTVNASAVLRDWRRWRAAFTVRHESGRRTLGGAWTSAFNRTDANVGYAPHGTRWLNGFDVSVRVTNLFATRYAVPGGLEHRQQSIQQDGRLLSLQLRRDF